MLANKRPDNSGLPNGCLSASSAGVAKAIEQLDKLMMLASEPSSRIGPGIGACCKYAITVADSASNSR